jgi:putative transposase
VVTGWQKLPLSDFCRDAIFCVSMQNLYIQYMDDKYQNKYRISSARLSNWDYGSHGLYYITICTKDRFHYFGEITSYRETQNIASLQATPIGDIAYQNWLDIPNHFSFIKLDEFVIMPNHLHGILFINKPDKEFWEANKFGVQSQNLASVVRGYKASIKTYATINQIEFNWQPRYYDHVIQSEKEYLNIREYIFNNPEQWLLNGDNEDDLYLR